VRRARHLERHREIRAVVVLAPRDGDRERLLRDPIDDRQRLEEVIDALARDPHRQLAILDGGVALVERDAVAIDDDASEHTAGDGIRASMMTTGDRTGEHYGCKPHPDLAHDQPIRG
jgi:hypothetical protein